MDGQGSVCVCTGPVSRFWEMGAVCRKVLVPKGIGCYEPVLAGRPGMWELILGSRQRPESVCLGLTSAGCEE